MAIGVDQSRGMYIIRGQPATKPEGTAQEWGLCKLP